LIKSGDLPPPGNTPSGKIVPLPSTDGFAGRLSALGYALSGTAGGVGSTLAPTEPGFLCSGRGWTGHCLQFVSL
jgi:hypothetical protein